MLEAQAKAGAFFRPEPPPIEFRPASISIEPAHSRDIPAQSSQLSEPSSRGATESSPPQEPSTKKARVEVPNLQQAGQPQDGAAHPRLLGPSPGFLRIVPLPHESAVSAKPKHLLEPGRGVSSAHCVHGGAWKPGFPSATAQRIPELHATATRQHHLEIAPGVSVMSAAHSIHHPSTVVCHSKFVLHL